MPFKKMAHRKVKTRVIRRVDSGVKRNGWLEACVLVRTPDQCLVLETSRPHLGSPSNVTGLSQEPVPCLGQHSLTLRGSAEFGSRLR
ncbi:hypothetical protein BHE74_00036635 [Ensete ventricosum]|nr:hypothetical protein BHE74_00036635 [Ensete ventricosum]